MRVSEAYEEASQGWLSRQRKPLLAVVLVLIVLLMVFYPESFGLVSSVPVIYVVGFHHSGTSLLRHILGSHPEALEIAKEHKGNAITLQALRQEARGFGKKFVVVKVPVNNEVTLANVEGVKDLKDVHFAAIRRDRADVVFSLSRRNQVGITPGYVQSVNNQIDGVWKGSFLSDVPTITLEDLSSDTRGTLEKLCHYLPMPFHEDMLDYWKTPFQYDNTGRKYKASTLRRDKDLDPNTQHNRIRVSEINKPVQPSQHKWLTDRNVTAEERELLRAVATY